MQKKEQIQQLEKVLRENRPDLSEKEIAKFVKEAFSLRANIELRRQQRKDTTNENGCF